MGLLDFNPVAWYESAASAKLEREQAEKFIGTAYSAILTFLWSLRKLPVIGSGLGSASMAVYLNLMRSGLRERLTITVPDSMDDPAGTQHYVTTTIVKEGK